MEKYKIEKDSIQETLVIPLYGRRLCSQQFPGLYQDSTAAMLMEKVDYDFSPLERQANSLMQTFGALEVAMRQNDLAWEVRDYLRAFGAKKPIPYRNEPYELYAKKGNDKALSREDACDQKAKALMETFMVQFNKRFEKGGDKNAG